MRKLMFIGAVCALLSVCSCTSDDSDPINNDQKETVLKPATKVQSLGQDGNWFGLNQQETLEYVESKSQIKTRGISSSAVLSEPGDDNYMAPGHMFNKNKGLKIAGIKVVTTENELAFLRGTKDNNWQDGAIATTEAIDWNPNTFGVHDMWPWYFHTKNAGDVFTFAIHAYDPNVGYPQVYNSETGKWVDYTGDGPCGTSYEVSLPIIAGSGSQPANSWFGIKPNGRRFTTTDDGLQEFWWRALGPDDNITVETDGKIETFKEIVTPTNAKYWCFDNNRDGDYSDVVILVDPSHAVDPEPQDIEGEVEVDIHQQDHKDWGEIKTSIHIRALVETVDIVLPIPETYQVEADDFAIRTYEAYYPVGNETYPVAVTVEHKTDGVYIHVNNITADMINALKAASGDGLTLEIHSYTVYGKEAEVWEYLKNSTLKVGFNQPTLKKKISSALFL